MDYNDFAESIKKKYPQYKDVDNKILASKVIEKYPVYKDRVEFETKSNTLLDILKTAGKISEIALPAAELAKGIPTPLLTKEARGVGQGVIQSATLGYGMPLARKVIPGSEQVPLPSTKEELVGAGLSLPFATGGAVNLASKMGKLAPVLPIAIGYGANPSNTDIESAISGKRAAGAVAGGVLQGAGSVAQKAIGWINPGAVQALFKGLKPGKWNKNFRDDAAIALPEIKNAGIEVNNIDDFVSATNEAKTNVWSKVKSILQGSQGQMKYGTKTITAQVPVTKIPLFNARGQDLSKITKTVTKDVQVLENGVDGDEIATKLYGMIKPESQKLSPEIGNAIKRTANKYKGQQITIDEAESRLQKVNADLTSYFKSSNRTGYVKGQQEDVASMLAERKVLRQTLYDKIQSLTGENIAPLKKAYGALMNVQDEALGRVNVATRQSPISLQEALSGVSGIADIFGGNPLGLVKIGASQVVKRANSSDRLVSKAVQNIGKKTSTTFNRTLPVLGTLSIRELLSNQYKETK